VEALYPKPIAVLGHIEQFHDDLIAMCPDLHAHPELGLEEVMAPTPMSHSIGSPTRWSTQTEATEHLAAAAVTAALASQVVADTDPVLAGEDFSFLLQARPGFAFLHNGMGPGGTAPSMHTPHYDFNDGVIPVGVALWASLVAQRVLPS
jgi:metal-dependent amidase/aminoacylase/carboxypeptidase family protein